MVTLRRAGWRDAWRLYRWRNHPSTRQWARDRRQFSFRQHLRWLFATLADPGVALFVAVDVGEGEAVGTCRLDYFLLGDGSMGADVSLTIAPARRGRGLGRATLRALADWAEAHDVALLRAYVREDNARSLTTFVGAGYWRVGGAQPAGSYVTLERRLAAPREAA